MSQSAKFTCPACAEKIAIEALKCKHCGETFTPEQVKQRKAANDKKTAIGCGVMLAIGLIVLIPACISDNKNRPEIEAKQAEEKRKGFHCLSSWDGAHTAFRDAIKSKLRDPNSFEHDETKLGPIKDGEHYIIMNFRSRNGFGGMVEGFANGRIRNDTCEVIEANLIE